ncbi:MAG TPA: crossover junction endodeoxyribonuclease RuvC [Patescibacteria group bacterium]|uniref:Crossover junction endodeoxyribonuclease RuvC n=1 Tax=Candidatus Woesebacteria bacterium RBG_13_46_13 TaxID=1802479 RepID=A0A1F7X3N8_9BACT|nr:MAG: crossover junction endodeoxyribonuclease RuvC [Candidatus Woesebacteria bacterium RBG_13_46_13]HJX59637.1 crossover junction endodeoxyribonuclease RuvC [Patescibacteria group bacterium]
MKILGIDPGTATTGFGFITLNKKKICVENFGLIETDKDGSPGVRLINIHKELRSLLEEFKPDVMAMERLFFAANAKTAMRVGQAQGVMLMAAAKSKIEVVEIAPGTIKKMIAGNGRADKKAVQKALRKVLGAKVRSQARKRTHFDNAADALAVALCYAYTYSKGGEEIG